MDLQSMLSMPHLTHLLIVPLIPNTDVSVASANNDTIVFYIVRETRWMLNSGCSDHISHDLSDFAEYNALPSLQFVCLANSATWIPYIGIGIISKMPGSGMSFHISITLLHDYILM